MHAEARAAFERFLRCGSEHINRHLLSIMSLLGPLRRCCSGGALRARVCLSATYVSEQEEVRSMLSHPAHLMEA